MTLWNLIENLVRMLIYYWEFIITLLSGPKGARGTVELGGGAVPFQESF